MSREYTQEEMRDMFLAHIVMLKNYWLNESRASTAAEKLEGFAFSLLVLLDGGSVEMPAFEVIAAPHETDKEFHQAQGENFWPDQNKQLENMSSVTKNTALHELWHKYSK